MKTQNKRRIRVQVITAAKNDIDPEDLWADSSVDPEVLIENDPLDVSQEIVEQAERPELADFWLMSLPIRRFSLRNEIWKIEGIKEAPAAFLRRLQEAGSS